MTTTASVVTTTGSGIRNKKQERRIPMKTRFTLIELLITIAIIAILTAILLPFLNSARATAVSASCRNNLKQVGLLYFSYANDSNGIFPISKCSYNDIQWIVQYFPQDKIPKYASCPAVDQPNKTKGHTYGSLGMIRLGDPYNTFYGSPWGKFEFEEGSSMKWFDMKRLKHASTCWLLTDSIYFSGTQEGCEAYNPSYTSNAGFHFRHKESLNGLFADGHIETGRNEKVKFGWLRLNTLLPTVSMQFRRENYKYTY